MKGVAGLWFASIVAASALDLTPVEMKGSGEGGSYTYLEFRDGRKTLTYMPPKRWEYRGEPARFDLIAPEVTGADIHFEPRLVEAPPEMAPASLARFEEIARQSLAPGASAVDTLEVIFNPLEIDGHKTVEVTLRYNFFGQTLKASYLYLVREGPPVRFRVNASTAASSSGTLLIVFQVAARAVDFDRIRQAFHGSLHSMAGL